VIGPIRKEYEIYQDKEDQNNFKNLNKDGFDYTKIFQNCYVASFKIYSNTNFDDLKVAACKYWGKSEPN
jgi:hypothetical protein